MNKSLFRRPGTKHFQLVHRSLRDPLIHDPSSSAHVLKSIDSPQGNKKSKVSFATSTKDGAEEGDEQWEEGDAEEVGDAAAYGVFFDDSEYDYMQHLRTVGTGGTSYLVETPTSSSSSSKAKGKAASRPTDFAIKDLPIDALPSHPLDETPYLEVTSTQAPTLAPGLQPDLDPSVKEVLEALEDDAYAVDDGAGSEGEDEFWNEIIGSGERRDGESVAWSAGQGVEEGEEDEDEGEWAGVKRFKQMKLDEREDWGSDEEVDSGEDTIGELMRSNAKRPKRKVESVAGSQFSMTSSAMFRNDQLRNLDDRFDEVEKLYEDDSDSSWGGHSSDEDNAANDPSSSAPLRGDLDKIMEDFLSRFEVLGGKMRPVLEGSTPTEKLDRIRRELASLDLGEEGSVKEGEEETEEEKERRLRRAEKERILKIVERQEREEVRRAARREAGDNMPRPFDIDEEKKDTWDCETVLSTYSNLSNHPRMLRLRAESSKPKKIRIDEKTGFPVVEGEEEAPKKSRKRKGRREVEEMEEVREDEEEDGDSDSEMIEIRETVTRSRDETPAERKARKAAVKEERAARRSTKKTMKEAFGNETKRQKKIASRRVEGGAAADVRAGMEGVRRLA